MGYKQSDFVNRAIARAIQAKDAELIVAPVIETKEAQPDKTTKPKQEEEKPFANPYEEFLNTWKQGDPLPLIPPGKTLHLCKFGNPLHIDTNYFDLQPEYKIKKPKVRFKHINLTLDSKSLGPKLRDEVDSLLSRAMMGRFGLKPWVDDKNKLRCPEGTPAANQFTDTMMSNCFILSPATAAGSAGRVARRAGRAMTNAIEPGNRAQGGFETARDLNNLTQQDFIDMGYDEVSSRLAVGGRIVGAMNLARGERRDPLTTPRAGEPYYLGTKEKLDRGRRSTYLSKVTSMQIQNGLYRLPNGEILGDITNRSEFVKAMKAVFPHVEEGEIKYYFDNAIPAGLPFEMRRSAKRGIKAFWEAMIVEGIENPDIAKWVTRFETDYNMTNAFEMKLDHFAPTIDSGGRLVSGVGQKLNRERRSAAQGGVHMVMAINPFLLHRSSQNYRSPDARSSGTWDSVQGDMHYTATHEFGHLAHFASVMQTLGFDVNRMQRYNPSGTSFAPSSTTGGQAQWRPNREAGGWIIDFTNMQNPMNSQSIELVKDAARNLQTRQYYGGRGNFNSQDLRQDLVNFYEAFAEAVNNNITDTAEERELMKQFAGGDYAASNPIETRAEYYAARRLFGETRNQIRLFPNTQPYTRAIRPFNVSPGGIGPLPASTTFRNYVDDFANAITSTNSARGRFRGVTTARNAVGKTPQEVIQDLDRIGRNTFGIRPGTWNITGAMDVGGGAQRVSLHAEQVRRAVRDEDLRTRRKRSVNVPTTQAWSPLGTRSSSSITGAMAAEKKYYPREPSYGAFIGDAQKIFGDAQTWEEFKKLYNDKEIVFFDYETTGIEHDADGRTISKGSPVQIGAVKMKNGKVIARFNMFMKPDQPLGEWSKQNLKDADGNLLTDEWLSSQPSILKAHQALSEFAGANAIFGVQYAPFDKDVLDATLEKVGIQWRPAGFIDTKDIAEHTLPKWTPENPEGPSEIRKGERRASNGLKAITEYLGVELGSKHHTADADSEAAGMVMSAIIDKAIERQLPTTVLDMKSQNDRIAKAKADYEKAVDEFEKSVIERSSDVSGAMRTSRQIATTRKSNRRTQEIKEAINKDGGNFGGDTSVRYIENVRPKDTLLGPTAERATRNQRIAERKNNIEQLKVLASSFIPNPPQVAAGGAPPPPPPPDGPDNPNISKPWDALSKLAAQEAMNGLNPDFYRYLNETPAEELAKNLNAAIMDFHDGIDSRPRTHVHASKLKDVIDNGFANMHQTNKIAGLDKVLAKYEADIGIHPDTPAELRPARGFVLHADELAREQKDILKFLQNTGKENPDRYFPNLVDFPHAKRTRGNDWNFGNAEIILNPGVSDRTAYGNGDLFNNHIEPVNINSTDNELISRAHIDAAFKTDNRVENIIEHLYNHFKNDHNAYRREKYAISPGRSWEPREAAIAGGFDANDIEEIRIPFDSIPNNFIPGYPNQSAVGDGKSQDELESFINGLKRSIIDDNDLEKLGLTEQEKQIVDKILVSKPDSYVVPDSVQRGMNRFGAGERDIKLDIAKWLKVKAAEQMKKDLEDMGIKLSVTNKFGLNIFDPKSFDKNAKSKAASADAIRGRIIQQMKDLIEEMRKATNTDNNSTSIEKIKEFEEI